MPRRYTLTHCDKTAQLYLNIGSSFAYERITDKADEVLAEWVNAGCNTFSLHAYIRIDDPSFSDFQQSYKRLQLFNYQLTLALIALRYGDNDLFCCYPQLECAPIWIYFYSCFAELAGLSYWGTPLFYKKLYIRKTQSVFGV